MKQDGSSALRTSRASLCGAVLLMSAPPLAHAASIASCTATATSIAFGTYTPLQATVLASTGTITISCTGVRGRNTVTIDLSQGASGAYATRTLKAGSATLSYNLYQDAANTAIWGNGTGGSTEASATIRRRTPTATLTVYGGVLARQDPSPGTYGDTITVSVNY